MEWGWELLGDAWDWATGGEQPSWWEQYKGADEAARQSMALDAWRDGSLQGHIDALSERESVDPAQYRDELGEVLDYLQQFEMMAASGMTWEQMAERQRDWMVDEARRAAQEASGGQPVTDEQIREAHEDAVGDQTYNTQTPAGETEWDSFSPDEKARWRARAQAAITRVVEWAATAHPELAIRRDEIRPALRQCEEEDAVAYVVDGVCYISRDVVVAIERDPGYALSTIQHELRGHPEFDTGFNVGMELYDEAAGGMPGYSRPAEGSPERTDEWERYEYFGSEIGALMREQAYWEPSRDLNGDGQVEASEQNPLGDPLGLLDSLLRDMQSSWEPSILAAYVTSMHRRFVADPRVTDAAVAAFDDASTRILHITP